MASVGRGSRGDDQNQYDWADEWVGPTGEVIAPKLENAWVVRAKTENGRTVTYHATLRGAMMMVNARHEDPLVKRVTLGRYKVHPAHL